MFKAYLFFPPSLFKQASKMIHLYYEFMAEYYMKN